MQSEAKVVPFKNNFATSVSALAPAMQKVHEHATGKIKESLQQLFSSADDVLFDMADRASTNAEQNSMFEAMRDLRLKRKKLEESFLHNLTESFCTLSQRSIGRKRKPEVHSIENLSLVQNDELEESVAVDSMVSKVLTNNVNELTLLSARFSQLADRKLGNDDNPLGPRLLANSFLEACTILGFEIQIKLIILKLFEKSVLNPVDELYDSCNEILIKAGILPQLTAPQDNNKRKRPSVVASGEQDAQENVAIADPRQVQIAFNELQGLLATLRSSQPAASVDPNAVPISTADLTQLLSHLQKHSDQNQSNDIKAIRQQLDSILQRASAKSSRTRVVGEIDNDVINLVSMLFEFILDDPAVPSKLKAMISRLQIPLLKVAVIDKTFFNHGNHPARRLLNEIGSAAIGWNDHDAEHQDSLYKKIEEAVQKVQHEFVDDPELFNEILLDFVNFVSSERRRSELLEQRIRDAEEGRARSELARHQVEAELNQRLVGRTLPETVVHTLQEYWSKVLLLNHLKHGENSREWQTCLKAMDQLIWSVQEHSSPDSFDKLSRLIPPLLEVMRQAFAQAALDPFEVSLLFTRLEVLHVQALQKAKQAVIGDTDIAHELELPPVLQQTAAQIEQQQPDAAPMVEVTDNISLASPEQQQEAASAKAEESNASAAEIEEKTLQLVEQLRPGCWFEMVQEDSSQNMRCKLAAIIKTTERYIFVNRRGLKVLEKNKLQFAAALQQEQLKILDDSLLFDRALESVIGDLRRLKSGD